MVPGFESALFSLFLWLCLVCASLTAASQEMFVQIMEIQYKCDRFELRTIPAFVLFNPDLGFTHFGFVLTCKSAQKSLQVVLRCWPLSRFSSSCWNLFDFPAPQSSGSELAPAQFLWLPLHIWELRQCQEVFFFQLICHLISSVSHAL